MDWLISLDQQLFLFLNGLHTTWLDGPMFWISNKLIWIPLYVWLLYLVYQRYGKKISIIIPCTALLILFTDQTTNVFKFLVARLRPTHNPEIMHLVHTVNEYRGGMYGFFSGHAANSFALATFVLLLLKPSSKAVKIAFLFYTCLTVYSRIYLGVHYPLDIIAGALCGIALGFLFSTFTKVVIQKYDNYITNKI